MTLPTAAPPFGGATDEADGVDEADEASEADETGGANATDRTVAGVLLAAGTSTRFGAADKLLATLDGTPIAEHAAATLDAAAVDPVIAVVSSDGVADVLDTGRRTLVRNPDTERGQATSVRAGVEAIAGDVDAAVFALGDMPSVRVETVDRLGRAYEAGVGTALAAAFDGERGNPVLFDARHFDALRDVTGDRGGRAILRNADDAALVETGDPAVVTDVDTRDDLARVRDREEP